MGMLSVFHYLFTPVATPQPGTAYHSPLQQFQEYPKNQIMGHGRIVSRIWQSQEPQWLTAVSAPVLSGGNGGGTVQGQIIFQPLVITASNSGNVG